MTKQALWLGDCLVVHVDALKITIIAGEAGGKKVHLHIHPGSFPHTVKVGDKLPLYTEVTYDILKQPSKQ